jgi:hypothetical protein
LTTSPQQYGSLDPGAEPGDLAVRLRAFRAAFASGRGQGAMDAGEIHAQIDGS